MNANTDLFADQPLPDDMLAKLGDIEIADKWPRHVVCWIARATQVLVAAGMPPVTARTVVATVIRAIAEENGGFMVYIPKTEKLDTIIRNRQIYDQWSGNNIETLARQYDLTPTQIYNIIREQRALHHRRTQPELPGLSTEAGRV